MAPQPPRWLRIDATRSARPVTGGAAYSVSTSSVKTSIEQGPVALVARLGVAVLHSDDLPVIRLHLYPPSIGSPAM